MGSVLRSVALLVALSAATFLVISSLPADPAMDALRAWNISATPEAVDALRHQWGLDVPLIPRYFLWLGRFIVGDWGASFRTGEPVRQEVLSRLPLSLCLGFGGLALAVAGAVPLGFFAAHRPGGVADLLSRGLAVLMQAVPSFFLGLLAIWALSVKLHVMRPFGATPASLTLATTLIATHSLAVLARVYRRGLINASTMPFMRTARAKGLSEGQALWRHGQRHALLALLSAARSEAAWVVGASATMEVLFGLPGISQFLVDSVAARDYFVLQAYVMIVAAWLLLLNAAVAKLVAYLDPRLP